MPLKEPPFGTDQYDQVIQKMLDCGDPEKMPRVPQSLKK
jgi:uncharacterized membrane protein YukC